ncbi:MAG: cytidylate kinase-like family protein [Oscillospiraceae bacterium]
MGYHIITISRQYGSGGRLIGAKLAEQLHLPFYDKELITLAAGRSSIHASFFENAETKGTGGFVYPSNPGAPFDLPLRDKVFLAQFAAIREIAAQGPCVLVGRCADHVLKDRADLLTVFLFADMEVRKKRAISEYGDAPEKIQQKITALDKKRANYYHHYAQEKWGDAQNYHICMDSGAIGLDGAVAAIGAAYLSAGDA